MVSMMFSQASGRPSANHGLFPKYGIEAVTLRGRTKSDGRSVSFGRLGRYEISSLKCSHENCQSCLMMHLKNFKLKVHFGLLMDAKE